MSREYSKLTLSDLSARGDGGEVNAGTIEAEITRPGAIFDSNSYLILPNAYYGMGFTHELDLLVITYRARKGYEVEIKISAADVKKDLFKDKFKKPQNKKIAGLWYAMPVEVFSKTQDIIPDIAGVVVVGRNSFGCIAKQVLRVPVRNRLSYSYTDVDLAKMAHLLSMRCIQHRRVLSKNN